MTIHNPYVATLVEMGYDEADCQTVAAAGVKKTFPLNIHGRIFDTQEEYDEALHDFLNGLWLLLGPWNCISSMNTTFSVRFDSNALNSPEYIGPFYSEDDAQDYADDRNSSLALNGIPSWVACYSVVSWLCNSKSLR